MAERFVALLTGSRDWQDVEAVERAINQLVMTYGTGFILRHGACPDGADAIAEAYCKEIGVETDPVRADWKRYGRSAGPIRNQKMVAKGADVCVAFPLGASKGTRGCMELAEAAGIPVINYGD